MEKYKIGNSYDIHRLVKNRKLILGGIEIPYHKGLLGHSDADCLTHCISEAILGSLGLGDLGDHFPDNKEENKNLNSFKILEYSLKKLKEYGYEIVNIDTSVLIQKPKMSGYRDLIKNNLLSTLKIDKDCLNIKFTTNENQDSVGKNKAVSCYCVVLIKKVV